MSKNSRQLAVLAVLLVVLAAAVVFPGRESEPEATAAPKAVAEREAPSRSVPVTGLRLDRLGSKDAELAPAARDPFRFAPKAVAPPRPTAVVRRVEPPPVMPVVPQGPPPPPPIPLKFIGVFDAPARVGKLAVLSDSRGGIFYGKEGDTIEGRYRVLSVSNETAELAYIDGRGRQTIRLSGQ